MAASVKFSKPWGHLIFNTQYYFQGNPQAGRSEFNLDGSQLHDRFVHQDQDPSRLSVNAGETGNGSILTRKQIQSLMAGDDSDDDAGTEFVPQGRIVQPVDEDEGLTSEQVAELADKSIESAEAFLAQGRMKTPAERFDSSYTDFINNVDRLCVVAKKYEQKEVKLLSVINVLNQTLNHLIAFDQVIDQLSYYSESRGVLVRYGIERLKASDAIVRISEDLIPVFQVIMEAELLDPQDLKTLRQDFGIFLNLLFKLNDNQVIKLTGLDQAYAEPVLEKLFSSHWQDVEKQMRFYDEVGIEWSFQKYNELRGHIEDLRKDFVTVETIKAKLQLSSEGENVVLYTQGALQALENQLQTFSKVLLVIKSHQDVLGQFKDKMKIDDVEDWFETRIYNALKAVFIKISFLDEEQRELFKGQALDISNQIDVMLKILSQEDHFELQNEYLLKDLQENYIQKIYGDLKEQDIQKALMAMMLSQAIDE